MDAREYARWFRDSTPYIRAYRDRTFVVLLPGDAVAHANLAHIVHDLALLNVLGTRVVLVHGTRAQLDADRAEAMAPTSAFHGTRRITTYADMDRILAVSGQVRSRLEALFSTGLPNTPLHQTEISVAGGNLVTARPLGILDGVDHQLTGKPRRVHAERIRRLLDTGAIVLLSPIGYSPSGQAYNLEATELATAAAVALNADKLIAFTEQPFLPDSTGDRLSAVTPTQAAQTLEHVTDAAFANQVTALADAVQRGVPKGQMVAYTEDGALLAELFTAGGHGTQICETRTDAVRGATAADVSAIIEIIRPLEASGALVRRDRDRIERELEHFLVAELDGVVVGCCAVFTHDGYAELACVAVHDGYRNTESFRVGDVLLASAEARAQQAGARTLFALTTQAADWFTERGFGAADIAELPTDRRELYNFQRNSKIMQKLLS